MSSHFLDSYLPASACLAAYVSQPPRQIGPTLQMVRYTPSSRVSLARSSPSLRSMTHFIRLTCPGSQIAPKS
jgi:hypothetical protein